MLLNSHSLLLVPLDVPKVMQKEEFEGIKYKLSYRVVLIPNLGSVPYAEATLEMNNNKILLQFLGTTDN
jgi:hypothetical protein